MTFWYHLVQFLGDGCFVSPLCDRHRPRSFVRVFVRREISPSNISRTVWPRITKFYTDIYTDIVYSPTGHRVIIYFRSEVIAKKLSKIPPPTASCGIYRERFKLASWNFTHFSRTIGPTNLSEVTLLAASGRYLSRFEKRPKMPHPTSLFALSIMQCQLSKASSNLSRKRISATFWIKATWRFT